MSYTFKVKRAHVDFTIADVKIRRHHPESRFWTFCCPIPVAHLQLHDAVRHDRQHALGVLTELVKYLHHSDIPSLSPAQRKRMNLLQQQIKDSTEDPLYSCNRESRHWLDNTGYFSALILPSRARVKVCTSMMTEFDFSGDTEDELGGSIFSVHPEGHFGKNGYVIEITSFRPSLTCDFVDVYTLRAWCVLYLEHLSRWCD